MTPQPLEFFVPGNPKGQPRARAVIRGKHAGVYDPGTADGWKHAVADAWRLTPMPCYAGPIRLSLAFTFPRPKGHFGTGRNAAVLKPGAPSFHTGRPDCDNLAKAVLDVLTRLSAWKDDSEIALLSTVKTYGNRPGVQIQISGITGELTLMQAAA